MRNLILSHLDILVWSTLLLKPKCTMVCARIYLLRNYYVLIIIIILDNDTTMQILTHSLVLSSAVGGRGSELREIFRTEYSDPLTDQFELLNYKADAAGVQDIKLAVDSPRIYLVLARATQGTVPFTDDCNSILIPFAVINFITPADDPDVPPPQPSVNSINSWSPVNTLTVSMINAQMLLMSDFTKEHDDNAMVMYPTLRPPFLFYWRTF